MKKNAEEQGIELFYEFRKKRKKKEISYKEGHVKAINSSCGV
jgi:hypothetical protein